MTTEHVFDYLEQTSAATPVVVVFGDEPFLKRLALSRLRQTVLGEDEPPFAEFEGGAAEWRDVFDELRTVSLFSAGGPRLAIVSNADEFVTRYRSQLESYLEKGDQHGVLVLDVVKWPSNTRLFKSVAKRGLQIECRPPATTGGKQKHVDVGRVAQWLVGWAKSRHHVRLSKNAARLLIDLRGVEFGILDQEIAKLALYTDAKGSVSEQLVQEVTGGWQAKTAWELVDAASAGNAAEALKQLNRLLSSGEHPAALFGPISWSLRRFAAATRLYQRAERQGRRIPLAAALEEAGFHKWQRQEMQNAERQLKRMGRERASQLYRWLLDADLALKGTHSSPEMSRWVMERLLMQMASPTSARRVPPR